MYDFFHPRNLFLIYLMNVSVGDGLSKSQKSGKIDVVCCSNPDTGFTYTAAVAHLMQDSFVRFHSFKFSIHIQCLCWDHQTIEEPMNRKTEEMKEEMKKFFLNW